MKILIPPPDSTRTTQVTCPDFLALLEADALDLRYEAQAPHPERGGGFAFIVCPVPGCARVILVPPPDRLMAKLRAGLPAWLRGGSPTVAGARDRRALRAGVPARRAQGARRVPAAPRGGRVTAFDVTVRCVRGGVVDEVCRVRARNATTACRAAEEKAGGCAVFAGALAPPGSVPRWRVGYVLVGGLSGSSTTHAATKAGARRSVKALVPEIAAFTSVVRI